MRGSFAERPPSMDNPLNLMFLPWARTMAAPLKPGAIRRTVPFGCPVSSTPSPETKMGSCNTIKPAGSCRAHNPNRKSHMVVERNCILVAMSIQLSGACYGPLQQCSVSAPGGAVIGIIGNDGAGQIELLRLATGQARPDSGQALVDESAQLLGPADNLEIGGAQTIAIFHTFALKDAPTRVRALNDIEKQRREGASILLVSHELEFLLDVADEVWWMAQGRIVQQGDPRDVISRYRASISKQLRATAATAELHPSLRRGDGRAKIHKLEILDCDGAPAVNLASGEPASVRVSVEFTAPVDDPVIGIMIRTRIGFEVYGTNTELERLKLGPCEAGSRLKVTFEFRCDLCPNEYTITAASHDPDGVWHDWMEDALAFSVADTRYTAGVANLRAKVSV